MPNLTELQMSIGQKIASGLDQPTLDLIYEKLMAIDDEAGGKIPVNCKIVFCVDAENLMSYEVSISSKIPVFKSVVRLRSDGNQLLLWGDRVKKTETPVIKPLATKAKAPALPAPKKKKATASALPAPPAPKKGMNGTTKPAPKPPGKRPMMSAKERQAEIIASNAKMYTDNLITRAQAIEGGVDVDALEGLGDEVTAPMEEMDLADSFGGEIGDLDAAEIAALDELADFD